jgi:chromosome partitioning protein
MPAGFGKIISFASTKGGVGKTTAAAAIAGELAFNGKKVSVLDCDPNGHLARWGRLAEIDGMTVHDGVTEETIMTLLRQERTIHDLVIVDLPGYGANILTYAFSRSDLVIIPAQASAMDLNDALKTADLIRRTEDVVGRSIAIVGLLTKTPPGLKPRILDHARRQLASRGLPVLDTEFMERTVFREMTFTGRLPKLIDNQTNAAANVAAVVHEVLSKLSTDHVTS